MMANRVIRDAILDSDRYWSCTIEARELYRHLQLLADDLGCVSLAQGFIGRRCFDSRPTKEKLASLLCQLCDADLIRAYEHDGKPYGFLPRFRQRLKRFTLKHPKPPESLFAGDAHAEELFRKINGNSVIPAARRRPDGGPQAAIRRAEVEVEVEVEEEVNLKTLNPLSGKKTLPDPVPPILVNKVDQPETWDFSAKPHEAHRAHYILAFLNRVTSSRYKGVEANLKLARARVKEYTLKELRMMITTMYAKWKDDPKMEEYLRPKTLFSAINCAQYIEAARKDVEHG